LQLNLVKAATTEPGHSARYETLEQAISSRGGRHVLPYVVRWRVASGWDVEQAIATDYADLPFVVPSNPARPSYYRGVSYDAGKRMWRARYSKRGKAKHLGYFGIEELAAHAYDYEASLDLGIDAKLNFPCTMTSEERKAAFRRAHRTKKAGKFIAGKRAIQNAEARRLAK